MPKDSDENLKQYSFVKSEYVEEKPQKAQVTPQKEEPGAAIVQVEKMDPKTPEKTEPLEKLETPSKTETPAKIEPPKLLTESKSLFGEKKPSITKVERKEELREVLTPKPKVKEVVDWSLFDDAVAKGKTPSQAVGLAAKKTDVPVSLNSNEILPDAPKRKLTKAEEAEEALRIYEEKKKEKEKKGFFGKLFGG